MESLKSLKTEVYEIVRNLIIEDEELREQNKRLRKRIHDLEDEKIDVDFKVAQLETDRRACIVLSVFVLTFGIILICVS